MAIPNKPLIITGWEDRTLGEHHVIFGETYVIEDFRQFLLDHVDHEKSWTEAEIKKIKVAELDKVHVQIFEKIREQAVPLASAQPSEDGQG